ncbi:MAG: C1 family peptidase [Gallionellaceae bacterium]
MTKTSRIERAYGWLPDVPDQRDHLYAAPVVYIAKLPASADLRPKCPAVYDQGQLGSCTANAIGAAIQFERRKQKLKPDFVPSRLFIYYNERVMEHSVNSDSGAQIRDGIKSVGKQGECTEKEWPYVIAKFASRPATSCYRDATKYKAVQYQRVPQILNQMKGCLASGYPFVFGFSVYTEFESDAVARTGELDMPGPKEKLLGGHAVMAVGYEDKTQRFIVRNSWSAKWGIKGYFTMPYSYLTDSNLADDFWTIRLVAA